MKKLMPLLMLAALAACDLLPKDKIKEDDLFSLMVVADGSPFRMEYDLYMGECHAELSSALDRDYKNGIEREWYCERQPDGQEL